MKRHAIRLIAIAGMILAQVPLQRANAQFALAEVIRAGIKRVVRAVDLRVQRLQNRTVWLQNAQKVLENSLSKLRLQEISEWTQKQTEQYRDRYQQFSQVRSAISDIQEVRQIVKVQLGLVREYQRVWDLLQGDPVFSPHELEHMEMVYAGILEQSIANIDQIRLVMASFQLSMADGQRMKLIGKASRAIYSNYGELVTFNRQNLVLKAQRAGERNQIESVRKLYNPERSR
ncbi:conjugal transfer protein TraI [Sphingobacterium sp.]|uniref:conjugal transfer protein TraI n=1 Tax=Sphingobacterium sp. TaxID=341027 RepID=UPI0028AFCC90|nr:conjugal transfer protein TraI [Sphingobacterium sp.]